MFDQSGGGDVNRSPPPTRPFLVMLPTWRHGKKPGEGVVPVGGKYSTALLGVINETGWRRQGGSSDHSQRGDTDTIDTIQIARLSSNHTPPPRCRHATRETNGPKLGVWCLSYTGGTRLGLTLGAHVSV